ncbi:MAG: SMC-Scp complex subunit ScpB [Spirochaetes bacterium]|nr:SMC-Scp complex subunit ScpB [Spirochaetota bacterium]
MSINKYSAIIESLLYYENDVVSINKIAQVTGLTEEKIKETINQLMLEYQNNIHGLMITEIAGGYSFQIKKEIFPYIKEYYNLKSQNKLSKSVLTVLSIIAYKQPITKNEIEDIRGVNSDNSIKRLLELNLIKITGRKDVVGKPLLYGTTTEFLKFFNLNNIKDLPKIDELKSEEFSLK